MKITTSSGRGVLPSPTARKSNRLGVKSVSNLGRWQMLKCTLGRDFHCISSRIDQLHTGKSDIDRRVISEDGLSLGA